MQIAFLLLALLSFVFANDDFIDASMEYISYTDLALDMTDFVNLEDSYSFPVVGAGSFNSTCNTLQCDYFYYFLTCPELGVIATPICVEYFLGFQFHCSGYPYYKDISDAPSICLQEIGLVLAPFFKNPAPYLSNQYYNDTYKVLCNYKCYQSYIQAATTFFGECYNEMLHISSPLANLNVFTSVWGQSCAQNSGGQNCYDLLQAQSTRPTGTPTISPSLTHSPTVNTASPTPGPTQSPTSPYVYNNSCCFGTQMVIVEQTPSSASNILIMPACVQRYIGLNCPNVFAAANMCDYGVNSATYVIQGFIKMVGPVSGSPANTLLPNIYVKNSALNFQGIITAVVNKNPGVAGQIATAIDIEITNYSYYDVNDNSLTGVTGIPPPGMADYTGASYGIFWYNLVIVHSSTQVMQANMQWMSSPSFYAGIRQGYGNVPTVTGSLTTPGNFLEVDSIPATLGAGVSLSSSVWKVFSIMIALAVSICLYQL